MEKTMILIKAAIAAAGGVIAYWLGGIDQMLTALLALIVLDYLSGLLKAIHNKALSSEIGWKGIVKKILYLAIVAVAYIIESLITESLPLREITIMFFIANEGISILENAAGAGIPIPDQLTKFLGQLKSGDKDGE